MSFQYRCHQFMPPVHSALPVNGTKVEISAVKGSEQTSPVYSSSSACSGRIAGASWETESCLQNLANISPWVAVLFQEPWMRPSPGKQMVLITEGTLSTAQPSQPLESSSSLHYAMIFSQTQLQVVTEIWVSILLWSFLTEWAICLLLFSNNTNLLTWYPRQLG